MVNSQYDKVGNYIRFLGYYSLIGENEIEYNKLGFHILAFGEIDLKTKITIIAKIINVIKGLLLKKLLLLLLFLF